MHGIMEGFYEVTVQMGSHTTICIPSFIKIDSGIQELISGDSQTHSQQGDFISLLWLS
jgi:hypothetical protein